MSEDNVVALPGYRVPDPQAASARVIEILEAALAEARTGNLRSIAIAKVLQDGTSQPILSTDFDWYPGNLGDLLNALGRLTRRVERTYDE